MPRFSLRLLLVAVTLSAIAVYFIARATKLAEEFVAAVSRKDFNAAGQMIIGEYSWSRIVEQSSLPSADGVYADLMPWEWQDVWRGQRRIVLRVARHNDYRGGHVEWTEDTDIVAGARGLEAVTSGSVDFNWPAIIRPKSAVERPEEVLRLEPNSQSG